MSNHQHIDTLIRKRIHWAYGLGLGLLGTLSLTVTGVDADGAGGGIQRVAWVVWLGLVIAFLATSGAWWRSVSVRALMNDETTQRHMLYGFATGFWVFLMCSVLAYAATFVAPLEAREVLRIAATAAIAAATLRFAALERRALQDD